MRTNCESQVRRDQRPPCFGVGRYAVTLRRRFALFGYDILIPCGNWMTLVLIEVFRDEGLYPLNIAAWAHGTSLRFVFHLTPFNERRSSLLAK